jgi:hypothetical protein
MNIRDFAAVLMRAAPGQEWTLQGDPPETEEEYSDRVEWHTGAPPTWAQVTRAQALVEAGYKIDAVRAEAEKRIASGVLINAKAFRADDVSTGRMDRLASALAAAPPGTTQTFNTAAGDAFTVDAAQAAAIYAAQVNWQGAILAASAALQADPPADPAADANWPAKPSVTV